MTSIALRRTRWTLNSKLLFYEDIGLHCVGAYSDVAGIFPLHSKHLQLLCMAKDSRSNILNGRRKSDHL